LHRLSLTLDRERHCALHQYLQECFRRKSFCISRETQTSLHAYQSGFMRANVSHPASSPIHRTTRPSARPAYGPRPWMSNSIDSGPNTSPTNSSLPCLRRLALSLGQLSITSLYGASSCFTGQKSMPASELSRNGSAITKANANAAKKR
jgi:hypothetical protein